MKITIFTMLLTIVACSPTSDKLDFRYKTEVFLTKCTKDQIRQLTYANVDVLIAAMKLQGMKYRYFHGLDIIDNFYTRLIERAQKYMPVAYAVMDTYEPHNRTEPGFKNKMEYFYEVSFEEYRYMGEKLDISRKNQLIVTDNVENLAKRFSKLQNGILNTISWASKYIGEKRQDTLWSSLHIQIRDLVEFVFKELQNDLDQMPNGDLKAKALHVLLEDIGVLLI